MRSLNDTLAQLLEHAEGCGLPAGESVPLYSALGKVLAHAVHSPLDVPAYDNSQMDGYAGVAVEMNNALEPMLVSQRIPAGHAGDPLTPGTVARIFTGAPIPAGANAVIMQEQAVVDEAGRVRFTEPATPGQNIRPRAGDLKGGQLILDRGVRLKPADLALCASVGLDRVSIRRPLTVAVFSSGDELRQPGESLAHGQIYDSNRPMILAMVAELGLRVLDMGCLPDQLEVTKTQLAKASESADVILTCGGVSVGEEDHIKAAIASLGTLALWKVAMKPGKPFAFGTVGSATLMGMPGNPVAAWVTFALLVRPYLLARMGADACSPRRLRVPAAFDWTAPDSRQEFLRGRLNEHGAAVPHGRQNSGVLSSVTESEGLIEIPASTPVRAGEFVGFIPYTFLL
jgi:molybdopterin molybdotransferase